PATRTIDLVGICELCFADFACAEVTPQGWIMPAERSLPDRSLRCSVCRETAVRRADSSDGLPLGLCEVCFSVLAERGEPLGDGHQEPESLVTQESQVTSDSGKKTKKSRVKRVTSDSERKPKRPKVLPFKAKPKSSLVTQGGMKWEIAECGCHLPKEKS